MWVGVGVGVVERGRGGRAWINVIGHDYITTTGVIAAVTDSTVTDSTVIAGMIWMDTVMDHTVVTNTLVGNRRQGGNGSADPYAQSLLSGEGKQLRGTFATAR